MKKTTQNPNTAANRCNCLVPKSIMTAERWELTDIELNIEGGELPKDLYGHVFIVAPVGNVNSGGVPSPNGNSILSGDGMIYRLDFEEAGQVKVKTRLVKPPDYYADLATRPGSKYEQYRFRDYGILRFSWHLGSRNQLNTAFLPIKCKDSGEERLLVTYDAGRPYEIDTETLEVITPVGTNKEWRPEVTIDYPFVPVLSTAHPAFDSYKNEIFTVNYGRSLGNFLETIPFYYKLDRLPEEISKLLLSVAEILESNRDLIEILSQFSGGVFQEVWKLYSSLIETITGIEVKDFVYLIRWDGVGNLERWKLVLPDGTPVRIEQTIHQIGVTKDYVVLMDTAFTTGIDELINNPWPETDGGDRLVKNLLARPSLSDSNIYIVRRRDLKEGERPICGDEEVKVVAQKLTIPLEAAHFLLDYENPQDKIVMHVAHICAWDVSEWVRKFDVSANEFHRPVQSRIHSMTPDMLDISRMGRYIIDGNRAQVVNSQVISDLQCTWGVGLYAYQNAPISNTPPKQLKDIYWTSFGLWKELMTKFVFNKYKNYKYRLVPLAKMLKLAQKGIPASLFRLHNFEDSIGIADKYEFPCGYMVSSPQFVPRRNCESHSTNGYIVCTVFSPKRNEIWIFDAQNLEKGPLCKLHHPSLNLGYTLHTAWLSKIGRRQAEYHIGVHQDYQDIVKQKSKDIQELFEKEVYPHFQ